MTGGGGANVDGEIANTEVQVDETLSRGCNRDYQQQNKKGRNAVLLKHALSNKQCGPSICVTKKIVRFLEEPAAMSCCGL